MPLIGITTSITTDRVPERAHLNTAYQRAVQAAGGAPVLLAPPLDAGARRALWRLLDGVVLTGGGDVDPALYGEARHATVAEVSDARDALEIDLTRFAIDAGLPLLAICRGIQVLNVALGGSLLQDVASELDTAIVHAQTEPRHQATHRVKVEDGTRLAAILGSSEVEVNSFHHQALARLGRGLRAVAWSPDGIVEGVEMDGARSVVVGVQWHPEELVGHDPAARSLFQAVVDESRQLR